MNKKPLVSVIIPCYNSEAYIFEAIQSVINQTWDSLEIIIVDDGSTDNSKKIIAQLIKPHKNIFFYTQKNQGACAARNLGIIKSKGEYIQFLDSDDILKSDKIERQISSLDNTKAITFCNTINFRDDDITNIISRTKKPNELDIYGLISKHYIFTPTVLIPRYIFLEYGMFNVKLKRAQEHEFNIRLASNDYKYVNLNFDGVYVRHHNSSTRISNQNIAGTEENDLYMLKLVKKNIEKYCINDNDAKKELYTELIYLTIYKAQNHGNYGNFKGVKILEDFIDSITNEVPFKIKLYYKPSKIYNFCLKTFGLTTFELLRFNIRKFIK